MSDQLSIPAYGPTITADENAGCYRVTAPLGYRFYKELHELLSFWTDETGDRQRAWTRAKEDRQGHEIEPCDDHACEWCARSCVWVSEACIWRPRGDDPVSLWQKHLDSLGTNDCDDASCETCAQAIEATHVVLVHEPQTKNEMTLHWSWLDRQPTGTLYHRVAIFAMAGFVRSYALIPGDLARLCEPLDAYGTFGQLDRFVVSSLVAQGRIPDAETISIERWSPEADEMSSATETIESARIIINPNTGYPTYYDEAAQRLAARFGFREGHIILRPALAACELDEERAAEVLRRHYEEIESHEQD